MAAEALRAGVRSDTSCSTLRSLLASRGEDPSSFRSLGYDDRTRDCFFALHGSFRSELGRGWQSDFATLSELRELPANDGDLREASLGFGSTSRWRGCSNVAVACQAHKDQGTALMVALRCLLACHFRNRTH